MSLSEDNVLKFIKKNFVCGWRNIDGREKYAGKSHCHKTDNPAISASNGAGARNVQMIITTPSGQVLHCLPGYWRPDALLEELEFAGQLSEILRFSKADRRNDKFLLAHLNHVCKHSWKVQKDSHLQGFDERHERQKGGSMFEREECDGMKTVDQVVHEKMAEFPFIHVRDFDIGGFVDVGTKFYDAHRDCKHDKPMALPGKKKKEEKKKQKRR